MRNSGIQIIVFIVGLLVIPSIWFLNEQRDITQTLGQGFPVFFPSESATGPQYVIDISDGCAEWGSNILTTTGVDCGSGGGAGLFQYVGGTDTLSPIIASTSNTARLTASSFHATSTATSSVFGYASTTGLTATNATIANLLTSSASGSVLISSGSVFNAFATSSLGITEYTNADVSSYLYGSTTRTDLYTDGTHLTWSGTTLNADDNLSSYTDDLTHYLDTDVSSYLYGSTTRTDLFDATYVPLTRSLTVAGTALDITSSAGAQSLASDRTWTLSFPRSATLAGDPAFGANTAGLGANGIIFEGSSADTFEGLLTTANITTPDKTWTLPNTTGNIALLTSAMTGTFDGNNFGGGAIGVNQMLYGGSAGSFSETAAGTSGQLLQANGSGVPTFVTLSSEGTIAAGGALTLADSVAVSSWNLTTPTLTSFFGTPCTGNDFLQDIGDTGTFTCTTATGGGGGGSLSTTTDKIGAGATSTVSYLTDEFMLGGSSSTTAEFLFDYASSSLEIRGSGTSSILSTGNEESVILGEADQNSDFGWEVVSGIEWVFKSATATLRGVGTTAITTITTALNWTFTGTLDFTGATVNFGADAIDTITEIATALKDGTGACSAGLICLGGHTHAISSEVSGLGSNVATLLGTFSSANFLTALSDTLDLGGETSFEIPNSADPTVNATGEIAIETASSTIRYYDGSEERVVYPYFTPQIVGFSSTTIEGTRNRVSYGSGTSTIVIGSYKNPVTVDNLYCKTLVGTVTVDIGDGTSSSSLAVTTSGTNLNLSSNNTFIAREEIIMAVGSSASSADNLRCQWEVKLTS